MAAFANAKKFFDACEAPAGWAGCKPFVERMPRSWPKVNRLLPSRQSVEADREWMAAFAGITAPGATYDLHTASYDEATRTAIFFATYHATHTGDGGPIPPTHQETHSHYVYVVTMSAHDKVERMVKIRGMPCGR